MTQRRFGAFTLGARGVTLRGRPTLKAGADLMSHLRQQEELTPFYIGDTWSILRRAFPESCEQVIDATQWDEATLDNYTRVAEAIPARQRMLHRGVSFTKHQAVYALAPQTRNEILRKARDEHLTLSEVRQEVRKVRRREVASGQALGTYRVILVTPHWSNERLDAVASLPIATYARARAAVWLEHFESQRYAVADIFEQWGVTPRSTIVVDRVNHQGPGAYLDVRHSYLTVATRGSCPPDRLTPMIDSVQTFRLEDGEPLPKDARRLIERLYDGPRLWIGATESDEEWTCLNSKLEAAA